MLLFSSVEGWAAHTVLLYNLRLPRSKRRYRLYLSVYLRTQQCGCIAISMVNRARACGVSITTPPRHVLVVEQQRDWARSRPLVSKRSCQRRRACCISSRDLTRSSPSNFPETRLVCVGRTVARSQTDADMPALSWAGMRAISTTCMLGTAERPRLKKIRRVRRPSTTPLRFRCHAPRFFAVHAQRSRVRQHRNSSPRARREGAVECAGVRSRRTTLLPRRRLARIATRLQPLTLRRQHF